jgi:hypothetical protein
LTNASRNVDIYIVEGASGGWVWRFDFFPVKTKTKLENEVG